LNKIGWQLGYQYQYEFWGGGVDEFINIVWVKTVINPVIRYSRPTLVHTGTPTQTMVIYLPDAARNISPGSMMKF
jgi:hypothetical protein